MRVTFFVLASLAALLVPLSATAVDTANCEVHTDPGAVPVGSFYVKGVGSYWQESNEVPGLQIRQSGCDGRSAIPRDTCIFWSDALLSPDPCSPLNQL